MPREGSAKGSRDLPAGRGGRLTLGECHADRDGDRQRDDGDEDEMPMGGDAGIRERRPDERARHRSDAPEPVARAHDRPAERVLHRAASTFMATSTSGEKMPRRKSAPNSDARSHAMPGERQQRQ